MNAVYPASAMKAKVQGEVIVEAIIAKDGSVRNVRVVRSAVPDLDQAALDAVKQWKYAPTLLDGVPVEVLISVVISFNLRAPLPSSTLPPAV